MSTSNSFFPRAVNWQILPDIATLCQYLYRNDLIELSETCKRIRNQFKKEILKKLNLCTYGDKFSARERINSHYPDEILGFLLNLLEEDLGDKLHLIKEIEIHSSFNDQYARRIISLFPNILKFKFSGELYQWSKPYLLTLLNGMKRLEHVELYFNSSINLNFSSEDIKFPKSLKCIKIYNCGVSQEFQPILDSIDSSYTRLTSISITSNKLLENLSTQMQNLKAVIILNNPKLTISLILEFLKKNPQLIRLDICSIQFTSELINAILSSNCLRYLFIGESIQTELESFNKFNINYSIEKLEFESGSIQGLTSILIKNCQNIKTIELNEYDLMGNGLFFWDKLNRKIGTLTFNYCVFFNAATYIQKLDAANVFNRVTFIDCNSADHHIDEYADEFDDCYIEEDNFANLNNYKLVHTTSKEVESFFTIKKTL